MKKTVLIFATLLVLNTSVFAQSKNIGIETPEHRNERMAWWREAKFGMFIHFGAYVQFAGNYHGHEQKVGDGAWLMNRMKVPVQEYKDTARTFNPTKYDAGQWAKMAKDAGMKYLVITAKHHDGFALFNSKASDWDIMDGTNYKKDLIKPLAEACKKQGIKFGVYYSQSQDWGNAGGGAGRRPMNQGWDNPDSERIDAYTLAHGGSWDPVQTSKTYTEYFNTVALPQVKELLSNYGDISILWWDTPMYTSTEQANEMIDMVKKLQPNIITNDRLKNGHLMGDYNTPEMKVPNLGELDGKDWETCMTMNKNWSYRPTDNKWKSSKELIQMLADIASKGGNLLLNVGPKPDGTFPQESVDGLKDMGTWTKKYGEAIYGTHANPVATPNWGRITAKDDQAATTLYLSVFEWPANGKLRVEGLSAKAVSAMLLGEKSKLKLKQDGEMLEISNLPNHAPDKIASVIAVKLDGLVKKKVFNPEKKMKSGSID